MPHYRSNLRDLEFNLFEFLNVGHKSLGKGPFAGMSEEDARAALQGFEKLCTEELATSYEVSDRELPEMDAEGNVRLPECMRQAMRAFFDGEWQRLDLPAHLGGWGAPAAVSWAAFELLAGANPALSFYLFSGIVARVMDKLATDEQKKRYLPQAVDKGWGGAMVITEPDAGSDVGSTRAKARQVEGDVWEIEGVKRFITNGDFDQVENIVHLVLARPEQAPLGTKGLSMFIVPKFWVEEDGSLGPRNGVRCTRLEDKMGIKGSVTCELTYGEDERCRGLLVGNVHQGIKQMFQVIEHARMAVGVKSMAALSSAYLRALEYTKERVQGPDLAQATDKAAPRVPVVKHPDVRRMLMAQKAHVEGMRALCLFTASIQDEVALLGGHGASEAQEQDRLNDLLLPLVKGYCSEKVYELLAVSLQCFGGAGYTKEFPIEQYIRDQKIDSLYEGTTHIQALDLLFRKVARDGGETLRGLLGLIQATLDGVGDGSALTEEWQLLRQGLDDVQQAFGTLLTRTMGESIYYAGLTGNRVLFALAELTIGWLLLRQSQLALQKLEGAKGADQAFFEGKVAAARWYAREVLPGLSLTRRLIENARLDLMELPDEAF